MRSIVYLGLGSNLGNRRWNIESALALIAERVGEIHTLSDYYETQPWGYDSKEIYLNVTIKVETELKPAELLTVTQKIEQVIGRMGKTVDNKYRDRVLDIDILLYNDLVIQAPALTIPHPLMHQRAFVLQPLSEIAPHAIHPTLKRTIIELLRSCHCYLMLF